MSSTLTNVVPALLILQHGVTSVALTLTNVGPAFLILQHGSEKEWHQL